MQRGQLQRQKVEALYAMPQICKTLDCLFPRWMKLVLLAAATYNFIFGIWAIFFPHLWFQWSGMKVPRYPEIWQSVGMIVGVYGVGYFIAAYNPVRHWPIILVGFLGKLFGPIGFAKAVTTQALPLSSTWITVTNDLIWTIPFGIILWSIVRFKVCLLYTSPSPRDRG